MNFSNIPVERLMAIASQYWPVAKGDAVELKYRDLTELWELELKKLAQWWGVEEQIEKAFPGLTIGDATATPDACFRCTIYSQIDRPPVMGRFIVVGCMSILAPVYTIYGVEYEKEDTSRRSPRVVFAPLPARMQPMVEVISREIETAFDVRVLSREIADTPVPLYIEPVEPPHTTLFHALFTSQPESLP